MFRDVLLISLFLFLVLTGASTQAQESLIGVIGDSISTGMNADDRFMTPGRL
jgi:hypothetical protein